MGKRVIGIITAVVLAGIGASVLVLYVKSAEDRALAGERIVDVLVVNAPVDRGTLAADLADSVEEARVPAKMQAANSVAHLDELAGMVTAVDLVVGEQLLATRFVDPDDLAAEPVEIPDGLQLVTVSLDPSRVLGGELGPGHTAGVLASFDDANGDGDGEAPVGGETTHFILNRALIANVQGEPQPPGADDAEEAADSDRPGAPGTNLLVTFALDAPSAERLVFAAEHGEIWLSLQNDETSEDGARIWTKDSIYQ